MLNVCSLLKAAHIGLTMSKRNALLLTIFFALALILSQLKVPWVTVDVAGGKNTLRPHEPELVVDLCRKAELHVVLR